MKKPLQDKKNTHCSQRLRVKRLVADARLALDFTTSLERDVGRDYLYTLNFSEQTKVQFTYFVLQVRLGIRHMLIRLDSASSPQGTCIP